MDALQYGYQEIFNGRNPENLTLSRNFTCVIYTVHGPPWTDTVTLAMKLLMGSHREGFGDPAEVSARRTLWPVLSLWQWWDGSATASTSMPDRVQLLSHAARRWQEEWLYWLPSRISDVPCVLLFCWRLRRCCVFSHLAEEAVRWLFHQESWWAHCIDEELYRHLRHRAYRSEQSHLPSSIAEWTPPE